MDLLLSVFITHQRDSKYNRYNRLDIFKYTLESYSQIKWDNIYLFIELDTEFLERRHELEEHIYKIFKCDNILLHFYRIIEQHIWQQFFLENYKSGKMQTFATVKITLAHNILDFHPTGFTIINNLMKECFPIDTWTPGTIPQVKSRMFEAAIMKCIILVYKDNTSLIEKYYEPGVDFLYYKTEDECNELIEKILQNYDDYKYIAENAFNKTINNYTTKHLVDMIQNYFLNN
jgi:UDP-N-acetylglucosamine 2-epimerase